ncbi:MULTISPECIES: hypothetical protein [unclassified Aureimonas]|uniref:hypothetical protein n=1 Tax=unclassified Aureimonas TaxID=2615206 RepID=UPI0006F5A2DF|nr:MULTISPECIES: hypothetical protein [unclassified Aureimonas]KQT61194.1 hypothetical protein ASG62_24115 [Aureimonas sp. Leaf427]KQT62963.1 hypothetical protein ASG54_23060 [Aureimonas sp. Leaf460]
MDRDFAHFPTDADGYIDFSEASRAPAISRVYLSMPETDYGGAFERSVTDEFARRGWNVVSPRAPENEAAHAKEELQFFQALVWSSDALAFVAFADGAVTAETDRAIASAEGADLPLFQIFHDGSGGDVRIVGSHGIVFDQGLSVAETRARVDAIKAGRAS